MKRTLLVLVLAACAQKSAPASSMRMPAKNAAVETEEAFPWFPASAPPRVGDHAICPVTGEKFVVTANTKTATRDGKIYAFCCPECEDKLDSAIAANSMRAITK